MADKKQPFRFRLPWLAPERPAAQPQRRRPTTETPQVPWRPTAAVPSHQPASRPAGVAPSQPPRQQPQLPPKGESQSPSPSSSPAATQKPKTSSSSTISKPPSQSTTTTKSSPSQAATESTKTTSKPTSSPTSVTVTKPPSPSSAATEIPKANSQSTSSPSGSTTKVPSPSRVATESSKSTSQSTSPSSSKQPRAATESSKSHATPESLKSTASSSSKQPPTTLVASPSRAANESPKATSTSVFAQTSPYRAAATESPKSTTPSPSKQPPTKPVAAKLASPSRAANESPKATSKSAYAQPSPSRAATESQTSSQHTSPSTQARIKSRTTSVALSPSKGDSKSKTSFAPPSPSRSTSQAQPEAIKTSQQQSPSRLEPSKLTTSEGSPSRKVTKREPEGTTSIVSQSPSSEQARPSDVLEEPKKETSQKPLQEPEPKAELTSATTKSPTSQDDAIMRERTDVSSSEKSVPTSKVAAELEQPQKLVSSVGREDQKPVVGESKETEGMKKIVQEFPKEEKKQQATTYEEPVQKMIIEMASSDKDSRDIRVGEFQATKRQQKREALTRKETFATTSYIGKQIKTIEGNTSMSFQNPIEEATLRQREIKEDISKLVQKLATESQLDENQVTVITLTGENRGASMLLSLEQVKKETPIHIHRGYKTDPDDSAETTTDGEVRNKRKKLDAQMAPQPKAYLNSNAQGVNNSIVVEASLAERNPGIHLFLSQNTSEGTKANNASEVIQTRKAECIGTTSERLTHESTVRRRCLRGLFMESSDSDLENPHKPRRHGCRYSCGQKNKDKEFM